jgi:hypothetical protein
VGFVRFFYFEYVSNKEKSRDSTKIDLKRFVIVIALICLRIELVIDRSRFHMITSFT